MKKPSPSPLRRGTPIFLVLGLLFFTAGLYTNQNGFTWIAIVLLLISLLTGGKWLRKS